LAPLDDGRATQASSAVDVTASSSPLNSAVLANFWKGSARTARRLCKKQRKNSTLRDQLHQTREPKTADRNPLFRAINSGITADLGAQSYVETFLGQGSKGGSIEHASQLREPELIQLREPVRKPR